AQLREPIKASGHRARGCLPNVTDVLEYEHRANHLLSSANTVGLCQYNRSRFEPETIRRVIEAHPHLVIGERVHQNCYYVPPDDNRDAVRDRPGVAGMIETILDRTESQRDLRAQASLLHSLYDVTSQRDLPFDEKVETILELGCEYFDLDIGAVTHLPSTDTEYEIDVLVGPAPPSFEGTPPVQPEPGCFCRQAIEQSDPVGTTDVREVGWEHDRLHSKYGLTTYFGVKVDDRTGPYGTLWFGDTEPRARSFTDAEHTLLKLMAQWVSYELERKQREARLESRNDALDRLNEVNELVQEVIREFVKQPTRREIERTVCAQLTDADHYRAAWIGTRPLATGDVSPSTWAGIEEADAKDAAEGPLKVVVTRALEDDRPVVVRADDADIDAAQVPLFDRDSDAALAVPIRYEAVDHGVLVVYANRWDAFNDRHQTIFNDLSETLGFAITAVERKHALVADEAVELTVDIRGIDHVLVEATIETDAAITIEGIVPQSDGSTLVYSSVTDVSPGVILDIASDRDAVEDARIVDERAEDALLELVVDETTIVERLGDHGGTVTTASVMDGEATVVAEFPATADVGSIVDAFKRQYPRSTVRAKRTIDRPVETASGFRDSVTECLTERQRTVLRTAYMAGYFDRPRSSTGEELADRLGLSSSTFHQHLRVGLRKLLTTTFDEESNT
ncbi:MAG: bacterio-opsin activator domain-containing protein, partial [Halapricum sp.]